MDTETEARLLEDHVGVLRLATRALLRVEGEDALSWLNGVVTQDLREPLLNTLRHALFVDVRGRVQADAGVLQRAAGGPIDVWLPSSVATTLRGSLEERIVMEDVELSLPDVVLFTAQGPAAESMPTASEGIPHDRLGRGGFDLMCPSAEAERVARTLTQEAADAGGSMVDETAYERARVRALRPRFCLDYGPDCYPQEAGLEGLAVSFDKGCYVGQEAVHMLEVRGRPPRRLVGLRLSCATPPAAGTAVLDSDGKTLGTITSAGLARDGSSVALAMLRRASAEVNDALFVEGGEAQRLGAVGGSAESRD